MGLYKVMDEGQAVILDSLIMMKLPHEEEIKLRRWRLLT